MTRKFDTLVQCPSCKEWHTAETAFERWMRNHESMDSRIEGIVRFDCDVVLHRYLQKIDKAGTRDIQCLMLIEVKSRGADVAASQEDTLSMLSQVLRNRRRNRHQSKLGRHAEDRIAPCRTYSKKLRRKVTLWSFGIHLLQMAHDSPEDSEWMTWDRTTPIDQDRLLKILRFEIDPDTLRPIDWRRRYSAFNGRRSQGLLFL